MIKLRDYWSKKSLKQKILLCIGLILVLTFIFFFVKGNFLDRQAAADNTTSVSQSESRTEPEAEIQFRINWIDIGILAVLFGAYGIHKFREKIKKGGSNL